MGEPITAPPKNWDRDLIGLFFTDDLFGLEDVCDFDTWRWMEFAACAGSDVNAWFEHQSSGVNRARLSGICGRCDVRLQCLDHALTNNERGWWGGMSHAERKRLKRNT